MDCRKGKYRSVDNTKWEYKCTALTKSQRKDTFRSVHRNINTFKHFLNQKKVNTVDGAMWQFRVRATREGKAERILPSFCSLHCWFLLKTVIFCVCSCTVIIFWLTRTFVIVETSQFIICVFFYLIMFSSWTRSRHWATWSRLQLSLWYKHWHFSTTFAPSAQHWISVLLQLFVLVSFLKVSLFYIFHFKGLGISHTTGEVEPWYLTAVRAGGLN